ncbi:MAG: hypothetical protein Fur0022_14740 [Anaerolineales bacterium]
MVKRAVCYSFSLSANEPMAYLRLTAPLRAAGIEVVNGFDGGQVNLDVIPTADVVVFQREFPMRFDAYQTIVALARQEGKPIIFEVDDLLFFLPENHPDRQREYYGPTLLPMFQALAEADLITVTTPKLREALSVYHPNVVTLPNCFDESLWQLTPPVQKSASEPLTLGYMGTNSHQPDLEYLKPVLIDLAARYPDRLRFHFWGAPPPLELKVFPQVKWTSQYFSSYPEFAAFFQVQTADLWVAPLTESLFNQCKSGIKFLEYSARGAPGVYSRLEPYTDMITHGHDGLLAASLDEWQAHLIHLIEDEAFRVQLAANAQATIREKWFLSQHAYRWQEAYQHAGKTSAPQPLPPRIAEMLRSINLQLYETFQRKAALENDLRERITEREKAIHNLNVQVAQRDHHIRELTAQLNHARHEIEQLQAEVMGYVLSKSWRMTRPLRMVGRKLKRMRGDRHV